MSKLQELIKELCPDGVEFRKLGEVCEITIGEFVHKNKQTENGIYPVYNGGKDNTGFYEEYNNVGNKVIISARGANAGYINKVLTNYWAGNSCYSLSPFNRQQLNWIFLYYTLKNKEKELMNNQQTGSIPALSKKQIEAIEILLPPLEVQNEIVRILDTFTSHTAELQAELQARKEQYEYYRNKLLTFDENDEGVKWMRMEEVGTFIRGKRFVRTDIVEKGISCIHYGDMYTYYGLSANKTKGMLRSDLASKMRYAQKNDVVIVAAGENKDDIGVGLAWLGDEPAAVHDACFIFQSDMYPLFVSHYLRTDIYHKQIRKYVSEAKICSISAKGLGNAVIPVPSFERQQSIASLLDKFESLVNDLTAGLPAEIAAVQEQYEYYRNKLLTFKRKS